MLKKITAKKIASNLILSVVAQIISLLVSFVLGFIVPKFIDEYQYSYWQTYILYAGYVGILHFGLLDGIVLRYSQFDYEELDKRTIRSQLRVLLGVNSILTVIGLIVSFCLVSDEIYKYVIILVSIAIITKNLFTYTSFSFQITNRISKYATLIIIQRAAYAIVVTILLICKVNNFILYCLADLVGDIFAIAFGLFINKDLYIGKSLKAHESLIEAWKNVSSGIILTIASYASGYIVGGAKMMIQWRWNELVFGQVSFSFSVSNIFLSFVTAISVVLFPSLKRMDEKELPGMYIKIRNAISPIMFFALVLYFPGCWILEKWLPNYTSSLVYLGILLPIIIFSSKVSLLTNNYLKAYRKERLMLIINLFSVIVGIGLFAIGAYLFNNIDFVLYAVVVVIMLRSIISEIAVMKIINRLIIFDFIIELLMTAIFIIAVRYFSLWWACLAYGCALVVYAIIYRKSLLALFRTFVGLFSRHKVSPASGSNESNSN